MDLSTLRIEHGCGLQSGSARCRTQAATDLRRGGAAVTASGLLLPGAA